MVHFLAISIFLLPIVTASSDDFWDDVDTKYNELSDPEDLPALATTSEAPLIEQLPESPQHSSLSNRIENNPIKPRRRSSRKLYQKFLTLRPAIVEIFKQAIIIDESSPQNISHTILEDKLLALGKVHEWLDIHTYKIEKYYKYWAKVCVTFWDQPLDRADRIACVVSRRHSKYTKRWLSIGKSRQYFDLLSCRCYTYSTNCRIPLSTPVTFLIHKGNRNEFFIFEDNESEGNLFIKGFKDGITLPNPSDFEESEKSNATYIPKLATLRKYDIETFNQAITVDNSYPQNVSLEESEDKLMEFKDIHEWPDLRKYDHYTYTRYWVKVCVFFWGKRLNSSHRQACFVSHSLGKNRVRTLFLRDRIQHFDLLLCKCHSYEKNYRTPVSSVDTFQIHQSSANEFFVFDQRETEYYEFTLFIKDFKGGITLPNPDDYN